MSTVASSRSSQSRGTSRSNRPFWSRQSRGRSVITTVNTTPPASRKSSHQSRLHQENVLVEVLLRQANLNGTGLTTPGTGASGDEEKEVTVSTRPVKGLAKEGEWEIPRPSKSKGSVHYLVKNPSQTPLATSFRKPAGYSPPCSHL